jgi:RNA polymerase sigma factor (sigma-70 family)
MHAQHGTIVRQIDLVFNGATVSGLTDGELVDRFMARRGPFAEAAFAGLVRRHGPMVLRVCRGILHDHHDAQDAFQATFLILARKAGSLRVGNSLGPWLHGVACRVASTARAATARRRAHESKAAGMTQSLVFDRVLDDVAQVVQEEIARLPDRYRAAVVLCDLEGHTYEEAAQLLRRPVGTIKSRLARGREYLRGRMIRRGVVPATVGGACVLSTQPAQSAVSTVSIAATSRLAAQVVTGFTRTDMIPSEVLCLMQGALRMMFLSKLKVAAAVVLVGCGVPFVSVIRGESSSSGAGQITGRDEPSKEDAAESITQAPAPADSPVTSRLGPIASDSFASKPWETVVRIRIIHERSTGFCSGTIFHSTASESLILSSAHQFKRDKTAKDDDVPYRINVDLFDGKLQGSTPAQVRFVEAVNGELVDCDFERDVSLVRIKPGRQLPASNVVPRRWEPKIRIPMLTLGCSEGQDATAWNTIITNPRSRGLAGNPTYEAIECQTAPKQGRTGGGLFTIDGYLAGICNFAEPKGDHGLYAAPNSIYCLLDRNNLTFAYSTPVVAEREIDDLIQAAERHLNQILDEWGRQSATWTTLDVRFTGRAGNSAWGDDESLTGRVVLTAAGRAFLNIASSKKNKSSYTESVIWTHDEVHQIHPATKNHIVWSIAAEDRGRLPVVLTLPFFWHLSPGKLKTRYDIELLAGQHADSWLLRFAPLLQVGRDDFSKAYIELDRSTYLPRRYYLISPDGKSTKDYRVTETICNQPVPDELWRIPELRGWKVTREGSVTEWISRRLVKPQLVP